MRPKNQINYFLTPVSNLGLSTGTHNSLLNVGIYFTAQLLTLEESEITSLRGLGAGSVSEIKQQFSERQLVVGMLKADKRIIDEVTSPIKKFIGQKTAHMVAMAARSEGKNILGNKMMPDTRCIIEEVSQGLSRIFGEQEFSLPQENPAKFTSDMTLESCIRTAFSALSTTENISIERIGAAVDHPDFQTSFQKFLTSTIAKTPCGPSSPGPK